MKKLLKRCTPLDLAAIAVCLALFIYLGFAATVGFNSIDESFYYTIVQRQTMGDRMLIDEWHVSQLNSLFQYLPYRLYTAFTGGTEGIILFLRRVSLAVTLAVYWFLYSRFKKYGAWGLLAVTLFCSYIPMCMMALNYYTLFLYGLAIVCTLLFLREGPKSTPTRCAAGIVLSCTVLVNPFLAAVYLLWCVLVLLAFVFRKREKPLFGGYAFLADGRTWRFVTVGVVISAAVFFLILFSRSPLGEIIKTVPELFTDYEYNFGSNNGDSLLDPTKVLLAIRFFGGYNLIIACALILAAFVLRLICKKTGKKAAGARTALFLLSGAHLLFVYIVAESHRFNTDPNTNLSFYMYHSLPVLFFGLTVYLLSTAADRRLFSFWLAGVAGSLAFDIPSDIALGHGGGVALLGVVPLSAALGKELAAELRARKASAVQEAPTEKKQTAKQKKNAGTNRKKDRALFPGGIPNAAVAVACAALVGWELIGLFDMRFQPVVEGVFNGLEDRTIAATVTRGPMKGLKTTAEIKGIYNGILDDLDVIRKNTEGPVYVSQLFSYCYLYLDRPYGSYSSWYVEEDSETRQLRYWELHPDHRPTYIYVPCRDPYTYRRTDVTFHSELGDVNWAESKLAFFDTVCDYDKLEGKEGYILAVRRWLR